MPYFFPIFRKGSPARRLMFRRDMKLTAGVLLVVGLGVAWAMLPAGKPYTVSCQSGTVTGHVQSATEANAIFERECGRPAAKPVQ